MIEKISQEQINDMGIYNALIEIAFNAHTKAADAKLGESASEFESNKWTDIERQILITAKYVFDTQ